MQRLHALIHQEGTKGRVAGPRGQSKFGSTVRSLLVLCVGQLTEISFSNTAIQQKSDWLYLPFPVSFFGSSAISLPNGFIWLSFPKTINANKLGGVHFYAADQVKKKRKFCVFAIYGVNE